MGDNERLWFPIYFPSQPMCDDVGCATKVWNGSQPPSDIGYIGIDTSGKPIYKPNTSCGTIPNLSSTDSQRFASAKAEMDAMVEKYKPIVDELVETIYESSQNAPLLFTNPTTRKARKHYKPKFTL